MIRFLENKLFQNRKYYIISFIIYRMVLDIAYIFIVHEIYEYSGFVLEFNIAKYLVSHLTVFLISYFYKEVFNQQTPSSYIIIFLTYIYFIPMTSLYGLLGFSNSFYILAIAYWVILLIFQIKAPVLEFKKIKTKYSDFIYNIGIFICFLIVIYVSYKFTGFRISLDFINVTYEIRAEAANYQMSTILQYGLTNLGIVLPLMLLYTLDRKKYFLSVIVLAIIILNYSIAMLKSHLFILIIALVCFFLYKKIYGYISILLISCGVAFSIVCYYLFNNSYSIDLFVRRVMYVPTLLSYQYFEYFNLNNLSIFQDGLLNKVGFEKEYLSSIPSVLAQFISNKAYNPNNGLIGDVYSNLGIIGILIMPIILILTLRILDAVSAKINSKIVITMCIYFAMAFSNSAWSTILFTHGFVAVCIGLYFFPQSDEDKEQLLKQQEITFKDIVDTFLIYWKVILRNIICFALIGSLIGCFYVKFIEKEQSIQVDSIMYLEKESMVESQESFSRNSYESRVFIKLNELDKCVYLFSQIDLNKYYNDEIDAQLSKLSDLRLAYNAVFQRVIFSDSGNYQYKYAKLYFKEVLDNKYDESLLEIYHVEMNQLIDECNLLMNALSNQYNSNFFITPSPSSYILTEITEEYRLNYQLDVKHILLDPNWYSDSQLGDFTRVNIDMTYGHRFQRTSSTITAYFTHNEPNSLENILAFTVMITLFGTAINLYYVLCKELKKRD